MIGRGVALCMLSCMDAHADVSACAVRAGLDVQHHFGFGFWTSRARNAAVAVSVPFAMIKQTHAHVVSPCVAYLDLFFRAGKRFFVDGISRFVCCVPVNGTKTNNQSMPSTQYNHGTCACMYNRHHIGFGPSIFSTLHSFNVCFIA